MDKKILVNKIKVAQNLLTEKKKVSDAKKSELLAKSEKMAAAARKLLSTIHVYDHIVFKESFSHRLQLNEDELSDNKKEALKNITDCFERLYDYVEIVRQCIESLQSPLSKEEVTILNGNISDTIQMVNEAEKQIERDDLSKDSDVNEKLKTTYMKMDALDTNIFYYNNKYFKKHPNIFSLKQAFEFSKELKVTQSKTMDAFLKKREEENNKLANKIKKEKK